MTTYSFTSLSASSASNPGVSEVRADYNTIFTNTTSKAQFVCLDPTSGSQVWQQIQPYATD